MRSSSAVLPAGKPGPPSITISAPAPYRSVRRDHRAAYRKRRSRLPAPRLSGQGKPPPRRRHATKSFAVPSSDRPTDSFAEPCIRRNDRRQGLIELAQQRERSRAYSDHQIFRADANYHEPFAWTQSQRTNDPAIASAPHHAV